MLTAIAAIIAAVIWPLLAAGVIIGLFPGIRKIISSRGFQVKFGSVEVSVQEATDKFQKQLNDLNEEVGLLRAAIGGATPAQRTLATTPPPDPATRAGAILWVDDKPENNALEAAQLRDRLIDVVQVRTTTDAMRALGGGRFDAVVSDMGRNEENGYRAKAGLELLEAIRKEGWDLPFYVYTGRRLAHEHDAAVQEAGGDGATASTTRLFEWVNTQLKRPR